tara:strand:+ start:550 stop:1203 length:654 start_codon:yes stop_codon:yes gene_type:complete
MNNKILLSKKGTELIEHYTTMAEKGYFRKDGGFVKKTYQSFELKKFKKFVYPEFERFKIKSLLDYGGGGSDWEKKDFEGEKSAKDYFNLDKVIKYEPAIGLNELESCDCVLCFDVLEHIYLNDLKNVLIHIYSNATKLVILQVACYEAAALLPTGENAHITKRPPIWWKGFVDNISIDFPQINTMLICSTKYLHAQTFKIWKNAIYDEKEGYTVELE